MIESLSLNLSGGLGNIDSVGGGSSATYSGSSESVDISSDVCEAGSHLKLNLKIENIQKSVQRELPVLSEEYSALELQAVRLMRNHNSSVSERKATNLFRMTLNLGGLYDKEKPLPLK